MCYKKQMFERKQQKVKKLLFLYGQIQCYKKMNTDLNTNMLHRYYVFEAEQNQNLFLLDNTISSVAPTYATISSTETVDNIVIYRYTVFVVR